MSDSNYNFYIITDHVKGASEVIDNIKTLGVSENDIAVVSKDQEITFADLPQADLSEKSNLPEALKRGALLGSGAGLFAGVLMASFPIAGLTVGGAAIVGMTAGGGAVGAWSASMIGVSENSPLVAQFESALDSKKTLIFCELDKAQQKQLKTQISEMPSEPEFGEI